MSEEIIIALIGAAATIIAAIIGASVVVRKSKNKIKNNKININQNLSNSNKTTQIGIQYNFDSNEGKTNER